MNNNVVEPCWTNHSGIWLIWHNIPILLLLDLLKIAGQNPPSKRSPKHQRHDEIRLTKFPRHIRYIDGLDPWSPIEVPTFWWSKPLVFLCLIRYHYIISRYIPILVFLKYFQLSPYVWCWIPPALLISSCLQI
jgi:hypothetical protein